MGDWPARHGPARADGSGCRYPAGEGGATLLGIGLQAIQPLPYHAGLAARQCGYLTAGRRFSQACYVPLGLSAPGKPDVPLHLLPSVEPSVTALCQRATRRTVEHPETRAGQLAVHLEDVMIG